MRPHVAKVLEGEYDLPVHLDLIEPPRRVLDIGANVGAFTAWARWRWPEAEIVAFEPVPENFEIFELNHENDARVFRNSHAVFGESGERVLRLGAHNQGEASAYDLGEQGDEVITVQAIDAQFLESADFVKIDAEGAEVEILQAMELSEVKVVALEWHGRQRREECAGILWSADFRCEGNSMSAADRGVDVWIRPGCTRPRSEALLERHGDTPIVFLAVPVYGGVDPFFHQSMMDLIRHTPRPYGLYVKEHVGDSLVSRARNRRVSTAGWLSCNAAAISAVENPPSTCIASGTR
jgi:FkbM family methyltransferase